MKSKKILIIAILIILIIIAVCLMFKYSFENWLGDSNSVRKEKIISDLGDEFILNIEIFSFPDSNTGVTVMDSSGKKQIAYFTVEGNTYKSQLTTLVNTSEVRCYQFYTELIYKTNNNIFESIGIPVIEETTPDEQPNFLGVAKALVETKEWKWIKVCSNYLIKAGDSDFKTLLKKYATGQFTQEEININKDSEINKEDIQSFCNEILKQK